MDGQDSMSVKSKLGEHFLKKEVKSKGCSQRSDN